MKPDSHRTGARSWNHHCVTHIEDLRLAVVYCPDAKFSSTVDTSGPNLRWIDFPPSKLPNTQLTYFSAKKQNRTKQKLAYLRYQNKTKTKHVTLKPRRSCRHCLAPRPMWTPGSSCSTKLTAGHNMLSLPPTNSDGHCFASDSPFMR